MFLTGDTFTWLGLRLCQFLEAACERENSSWRGRKPGPKACNDVMEEYRDLATWFEND